MNFLGKLLAVLAVFTVLTYPYNGEKRMKVFAEGCHAKQGSMTITYGIGLLGESATVSCATPPGFKPNT